MVVSAWIKRWRHCRGQDMLVSVVWAFWAKCPLLVVMGKLKKMELCGIWFSYAPGVVLRKCHVHLSFFPVIFATSSLEDVLNIGLWLSVWISHGNTSPWKWWIVRALRSFQILVHLFPNIKLWLIYVRWPSNVTLVLGCLWRLFWSFPIMSTKSSTTGLRQRLSRSWSLRSSQFVAIRPFCASLVRGSVRWERFGLPSALKYGTLVLFPSAPSQILEKMGVMRS